MNHNKKLLIQAKLVTLNAYGAKPMQGISSKLFKSAIVRASLILACWDAMSGRAFALIDGYGYNTTNIYKTNFATGVVTNAYTFPTAVTGAAIAQRPSDGMIFYMGGNVGNDPVFRWNPNTPTVAPVLLGTTGTPQNNAAPGAATNPGYFPRLTFSPNGTLYAVNGPSTILYSINQTTGAATQVGANLTGTVSGGGDMAFAPDGTLYMMVGTTLYRVPLAGGAVTSLGAITNIAAGTTITGLAVDVNGRLVGSNSATPGVLYEIPYTGGAATLRAASSPSTTINDLASLVAPEFIITKTHTGNFTQGQTGATYTVTVKNDGNLSSTGVTTTVTDTVPTDLTPTAASGTGWTCGISGQTVTCTRTDALAPGASFPPITLTVNVASNAPTSITNIASVANPTDPITFNNTASDTTTINLAPDLTIAKSHTGNFNKGQTGTYTITATNSGTTATSGTVTISDTVPTGLTPITASGTGWTCTLSGQVVTCTRADALAVNTSYPPITLTVNVAPTAPASITNTATVSGGGQTNTINDSASDATTINPSADLSLTKTVNNASPNVGDNVTFTVTLNNTGPDAATGVNVADLLPAGLTFVSANPVTGTSYDNTTGVWTVGTVASATSKTLQIVATVATAGAKTNTAQVSASTERDPDSTPNNNIAGEDDQASVTVTPPTADLSLTKTHIGNFTVGQNGNYTLTVNNNGPSTAASVTVTDTLPTGLTFVSGTGTGWTCSASGQTVTCTNSNPLASGANSTINLTVAVGVASSTVTNTATVSSTTNDPTPGNNTASDPTTVITTADIALTKTHIGNFTVGQNGTYILRVSNNGLSTAAGSLTVTDTLPTGLSFVSGIGTNWSCSASGQTVTCTNPNSLASGAISQITLTVAVGSQAAPNVTNTASASSTTNDPTPGNNTASDPTIVRPSADLSLTKTTNNSAPRFGDSITYTVTLTNSGPSNSTNVQVTDRIPPGLISVIVNPAPGTTYNSLTGVWNVPSLNSGASVQLRITGIVNNDGVITNTAEVTASDQFDPDSTPNNNVASEDDQASVMTPVVAADLSITKTDGKTTVNAGSPTTYTIVVTNNGPSDITNATVSDTVPSSITGVTWTCTASTGSSCGNISGSGNTINTTVNLLNGGTATYTVQGTIASTTTGSIQNTASVTVPTGVTDTVNGNNSATDTTNVIIQDPSQVRLVKRITAINSVNLTGLVDDPNDTNDNLTVNWPSGYLRGAIAQIVQPGDTVEYTIYFLSDGGSDATNVKVCDLVPANTTFLRTAFNGFSPRDGGLSADLGTALALGSTSPTAYLTNVADSPDRGQFFPAGTSAPAACSPPTFTTPLAASSNQRGAVVVDVATSPITLLKATAPGTPSNSYGFIRFKVRVN